MTIDVRVRARAPVAVRSVSRATVLSGAFNVLGSGLGLVRDLMLATYFGATGTMDAFLVAWTVPETASPLLIEDAMAFLLVPAFSRAVESHELNAVRRLVRRTLPPLVVAMCVASLAGVAVAPWLVRALAPGIAKHLLAVRCVQLVSMSILAIGVTGYLSAALRSRHVFGPPAAIYVAFNGGLVAMVLLFHGHGVIAAAAGVVVGSFMMVALQAPWFVDWVGRPGSGPRSLLPWPQRPAATVALVTVAPIAVFTLTRQAQTFVERFLGSNASTGTISHLNFAQKIAQVPMSIVMVVSVVSFPALSRALASGRRAEAGRRLAADLRVSAATVLASTAYLVACAPLLVRILFQHGAFTPADTRATADVIRVYSLGLLGQVLVGVTVRVYFATTNTGGRRAASMWFPAQAMAFGLALTAGFGAYAVRRWGGPGIAAANALGISATALILLIRVGRKSALSLRQFTVQTTGFGILAATATLAAWAAGVRSGLPAPAGAVLAAVVVCAVFGASTYFGTKLLRSWKIRRTS